MSRQHFIYIPGLGKPSDYLRRAVLFIWKVRSGATVELVEMNWGDQDESFMQKQARVVRNLEALPRGTKAILIGESAGGAVAISLLKDFHEQIERVVTVCGKNRRPHTLGAQLVRRNPALPDAVRASEGAISTLTDDIRSRLRVAYSECDTTVRSADTRIDGTQEIVIHTKGHFRSIATILLGKFDEIRGQDVA